MNTNLMEAALESTEANERYEAKKALPKDFVNLTKDDNEQLIHNLSDDLSKDKYEDILERNSEEISEFRNDRSRQTLKVY